MNFAWSTNEVGLHLPEALWLALASWSSYRIGRQAVGVEK